MSAFQLRIGHLAGDGALPNKVIEAAFLLVALYLLLVHIGGTDGFVSLLSTFRTGVILASLDVLLAHLLCDDRFAGTQTEFAQIDTICTHIGDASAFIKVLGYHHGLSHSEAELVSRFLLQCACREWGSGRSFYGFCLNVLNGKLAILQALQECLCLFDCGETSAQFGFHFVAFSIEEDSCDAIVLFAAEILNLAFTLNNQSDSNALDAASRKAWLHFAPKHGTELEPHDSIQNSTSLLSVHQIEVNLSGVLYGVQNGGFRDFVEDDSTRIFGPQSQHFIEVPTDSFSFAVFIGSQPDHVCLICHTLQLSHHLLLVGGNFVLWFESLLVHAERPFLQVADVSVAGQYLVFVSQKLFYRLSLCWALHNYQIILRHYIILFYRFINLRLQMYGIFSNYTLYI